MEYLAAIRDFEAKTGRELDAIIAPVTATAAILHNQFKYYGYATVINVLDFTSVVVPVTFADKNIDVKTAGFTPLTDLDATVQEGCELLFLFGSEVKYHRSDSFFKMIQKPTMARRQLCRSLGDVLPKRESWLLRRRLADCCIHECVEIGSIDDDS